MDLDSYPNAYSLRFSAHVMYVYLQSVLNFAKEIANTEADTLEDDDKQVFFEIADYLEQASFEAEKLRKRLKRAD